MVNGLKQEMPLQGVRESFWKPVEQESGVALLIVPALLLSAGKGETESNPQYQANSLCDTLPPSCRLC